MSGILGIMLANKSSDPSVMATGGQLTYDLRGYRYHVFTAAGQTAPGQPNAVGAAGSFIVQNNDGNKLFDVLCVGGGGAGGVTPSNTTGADGGGGGAVREYFNIPITLPSPETPVSFPVYVGVGAGYAVPTNVGAAVSLGGTQFPNGVSNPLYITALAQFNSRFGDTPLGYTAAGGAPAGNYPSSQVSSYGRPAGASGNGNPGGADFPLGTRTGGSGGGGAAGTGSIGNPWWPVPAPLLATPSFPPANYYPTPAPQSSGGIGGSGATSTIAQPDAPHGNVFGGGGGGGGGVPNAFPAPVAPGGAGGPGGGGIGGTGGAGSPYAGAAGGTSTGGGGGGQAAVPSGSVGTVSNGGPGIVVIRYPYKTIASAPTSVTVASNGSGQAIVSFAAPSSDGGAPITSYTVVSSPGGITATGSTSPITITGLTNGTSYTFTVYATNSVGNGPSSVASSPFTPYASIVASGGQLVYDLRGYRYHVFTSAGQTAPNQPIAVGAAGSFVITSNPGNKLFDVMCVGGGGAGGSAGAYQSGAGGGGGGAVVDYFNIPITMPAPGASVSLPVYVGAGLGLGVPTSGGGIYSGGLGGPGGFPGTYPTAISAQFNSRFGDTPLGYTANAGQASGQVSYSYSGFPLYPAGASGNGNAGGSHPAFPAGGDANVQVGGAGGGGAGGTGYFGSPLWPVPSSPTYTAPGKYFPTSSPQLTGGAGGIGFTSSIAQSDSPHGNVFGGGGGGGVGVGTPAPTSLGGTGGPGGGGPGGSVSSYSGPGYRGFDGTTNTGGGGGGIAGGSNGPYSFGGPGIVVVRYPYP